MKQPSLTKRLGILLIFISNLTHAGTDATYDFENIGNGNNIFVSSGQTFTVSPELIGVVLATYGSDLNGNQGTSDGYMDTGFQTSNTGNVGGVNAPVGYTFKAQRFDVWPSENQGGVVQPTGSQVRVLGYRDGQQIISADVAMIDFGQATNFDVRWHRIDLSNTAFGVTDIDSVQFELIGNQDYIAVDNFIYSDLQVANNLPTIAGSVANQAVNDDTTLLPFQNIVLTEPDGEDISLTVTLDNNGHGVFTPASLSASGFVGTGPYSLSNRSAAAAQTAIRLLEFDPIENLVPAGQTTTTVFTIVSQDGAGSANDNNTSVIATSIDQQPVAVADSASLLEDAAAITIDVLSNDADSDGGPKTVTAVNQPNNGTVVNNSSDVTYEPDADYCNDGNPTDDFNYTVNGNNDADVAVTVTCVNDAPSFAVMGDVDATGLVDSQNMEIQVTGFAHDFVFGPANESSQGVLGFFPNCNDPDGVIDFILVDTQGKLTVEFTLDLGVANCTLTMLDDGGTNFNGQNTSAPVVFNVALTDMIFANGFETATNVITKLSKELAAESGQEINLIFDESTYLLQLRGEVLQLSMEQGLASQKTKIEAWVKRILEASKIGSTGW